MDTTEFKTKLANSSLIGTSMGCASSINSRLEYALECVKMMEPNCDIEQKYLLIHIKSAMKMADEIQENLNKIEY